MPQCLLLFSVLVKDWLLKVLSASSLSFQKERNKKERKKERNFIIFFFATYIGILYDSFTTANKRKNSKNNIARLYIAALCFKKYVSTSWEDFRAPHPLGSLLLCPTAGDFIKNGGKRRVAVYD